MTCGNNWESQLHLSRHRTPVLTHPWWIFILHGCPSGLCWWRHLQQWCQGCWHCAGQMYRRIHWIWLVWRQSMREWARTERTGMHFTFSPFHHPMNGHESPLKYTKICSIKSYHLINVKGLRKFFKGWQSWEGIAIMVISC